MDVGLQLAGRDTATYKVHAKHFLTMEASLHIGDKQGSDHHVSIQHG